MNSVLFILLIVVFFVQGRSPVQNFSVRNLREIPSYEYYRFRADDAQKDEKPVVIEYRSENGQWHVSGSMPINRTHIEESYVFDLQTLNVLSYESRQVFDRGSRHTKVVQTVDTKTDEPNEFLIGPFQALMYVLRTFPFQGPQRVIRVQAPQQESDRVGIQVRHRGETRFETPATGVVTGVQVIEVSVRVPLVGGFLPRVTYYFLPNERGQLIALEGAFSMDGKNRVLRLQEYRYDS